jgi:hypothetical protein
MKSTILLVGLTLSLAINAMGQQPNPQATRLIQESLSPLGQQLGDSAGKCIASIKRISFKRQPLPSAIKPHVPKTAFVRLVLSLSDTDVLTVYEMKDREAEPYLDSPDTRLLVTRNGRPIYRYAIKDLHLFEGEDLGWGMDAVAMNVAHLCSPDTSLIYLVLQAGNSGGYYLALKQSSDGYIPIPVSTVDQGRLVLSNSNPRRVEVWTTAEQGACTACPKHFLVKTLEFDGSRFRLISKTRTRNQCSGFQESPLVVKP